MSIDELDINAIKQSLTELRQQADELRRHL